MEWATVQHLDLRHVDRGVKPLQPHAATFHPTQAQIVVAIGNYLIDMGKSSWPELMGVCGETAVSTIVRENTKLQSVSIVKEGMMVTMDFRCDRVRVWVDKNGNVKQVPHLC